MASTLTPGKALDMLAVRFPKITMESIGPRLCTEVQDYIWHKYPWKWSLSQITPFFLTREMSDYGPPEFTLPTDLYGLYDAWLRGMNNEFRPLTVLKELTVAEHSSRPTAICVTPERYFRLNPRPDLISPEWWVEGKYKKTPTKIVSTNVNSYLFPWDDMWFEVFRKGLSWKFRDEILGDPNAIQDFQLFEQKLQVWAGVEGFYDGATILHPSEGLALGG